MRTRVGDFRNGCAVRMLTFLQSIQKSDLQDIKESTDRELCLYYIVIYDLFGVNSVGINYHNTKIRKVIFDGIYAKVFAFLWGEKLEIIC